MNGISHRQSRGNSARRRRRLKARQARARRSRASSRPVFGVGKVHYEIGARINAMSYGGIGTMRRLASRLGLVREVNARLKALKRHLPYHESDHVLNIAFNVLCGGTRLQDIESLRNDAAYMDALGAEVIPSPTAAGDFTRRLGEAGVIELMDAAPRALRHRPGPRHRRHAAPEAPQNRSARDGLGAQGQGRHGLRASLRLRLRPRPRPITRVETATPGP